LPSLSWNEQLTKARPPYPWRMDLGTRPWDMPAFVYLTVLRKVSTKRLEVKTEYIGEIDQCRLLKIKKEKITKPLMLLFR
jgi:hypothetical protein